MSEMEGMTYRRIPGSICCSQAPWQVLKRVNSSVLLAPSACCHNTLRSNNTDPKLKVISFIELLAKALA